ncbi:4'-phosphopantetheinyl transferase family protein [Roseospira visakhapatnamensis]|uniref:4'-phosphopantetheinyl transferase n=1 Tax=Roseospira visakhapatnamensis TaxID=390880 RepID=A0A7W6RAT4_9PROT|nr:4'-phosphopantetheinyl transferase superfamily protein [Roseospira visakhapatnamensis]MBB4265106.1 4'-phosphopantetheinyl transferase [Roseospira visakhapatnamensis]
MQAFSEPAGGPCLWSLDTTAMTREQETRWRVPLDAEECRAADRLLRSAHRSEAIAAHALRRALLSSLTGIPPHAWRFTREPPLGKPRVAAPLAAPPDVNLTHTGGLVAAVASGDAPVGVDAEALDRQAPEESLMIEVLTPAERATLPGPGASRARAFLRLWVAKEAVAKALGLGLSRPLAGLEILDAPPAVRLHPPWPHVEPAIGLRLLRPTPAHVLAVAMVGAAPGVPALAWRHLDATAFDRMLCGGRERVAKPGQS